jgi:hypothetical protein
MHPPLPSDEDLRLLLEAFAVDGSTSLFADLERRLLGSGHENVKLPLENGLMGRRTGKAMFHSSRFSPGTNQLTTKVSRNSLLDRYAEGCEYARCALDLIKCGIEGSEFEFLQNYPDLRGADPDSGY